MPEETQRRTPIREQWRALRLLVSTTVRHHPLLSLGSLFDAAGAFALFLGSLALKFLIDGVVAGDRRLALMGALAAGALPGLAYLTGWAGTRARISLSERMGFVFDAQAAELAAGLPGLSHLEHPDHLDQHQLVTQGAHALGAALNDILNTISTILRTLTLYLTLATVSPTLMLLGLLGLPSVRVQARSYRLTKEAQEEATPHLRLARDLETTMSQAPGGREIRVFGISKALAARRHTEEIEGSRIRNRARLKIAPGSFGVNLLASSAMVIGTLVALRLAFDGRATAGDVALVLTLAANLPAHLIAVVDQIGSVATGRLLTVGRFLWLVNYAEEEAARYAGTAAPPNSISTGIVFEDVSFRYPGTEAWVLRHFSATFDAGAVTAVVGDNGAGKTTLVKLLCRFYDPDEGRILVDGVDLREFDVVAWRQRVTMANQDFARLELIVRESVGVGQLAQIDDVEAVMTASRRAGAVDVIERLESSLDTQLGRQWENGTDLSMGQWQKLALARGLMRADNLLQLFDEPTASLDAGTEHALFERLTAASKELATTQRGTVTVLVSHRFSTVRAADRILVISEGRLVENGRHADLLAAGGLYAELYEIQASAYR